MFPIRKAKTKDRESIKQLHINNHLKTTTRTQNELNFQLETLNKDFPHLFHDEEFKKTRFWVSEYDNTIIGCIGIKECNEYHLITCFSVAEQHQNKGIGSQLFETLINFAKESGIFTLKLFTLIDKSKSAYHIYKKYGFVIESSVVRGPFILSTLVLSFIKV